MHLICGSPSSFCSCIPVLLSPWATCRWKKWNYHSIGTRRGRVSIVSDSPYPIQLLLLSGPEESSSVPTVMSLCWCHCHWAWQCVTLEHWQSGVNHSLPPSLESPSTGIYLYALGSIIVVVGTVHKLSMSPGAVNGLSICFYFLAQLVLCIQ